MSFGFFLLLALLGVLVLGRGEGGEVIPPSDYDCDVYADCARCVSDINCGWCAVEGICTEGNPRRPRNGTMTCNAYDYAFCSGPNLPPFEKHNFA